MLWDGKNRPEWECLVPLIRSASHTRKYHTATPTAAWTFHYSHRGATDWRSAGYYCSVIEIVGVWKRGLKITSISSAADSSHAGLRRLLTGGINEAYGDARGGSVLYMYALPFGRTTRLETKNLVRALLGSPVRSKA
jgi:hypothetical protein